MKIFIASDHAGFELKQILIKKINESENKVVDLGTSSLESCDYPIFARKLVEKLLANNPEYNRGVLICGTGIGMSIAANRNSGIRAALCFNEEMAEMSRRHNNANVLVLGARIIPFSIAE
ncbi:MAG: ribose 5-phosphate isomerase B, partial [Alphaproteobacteria bacterium]|nr:ribose 5-phosphate isomerase B [Alphaproteobacteria bacterium]